MKMIVTRLLTIAGLAMLCLGVTTQVFAQATPSDMNGMNMGGSGESHPAHIHDGSCDQLGEVVAPLSNVSYEAINEGTPTAGDSTAPVGASNAIPVESSVTTVQMALSDIVSGPHALNVHESAENIGNYVACGDIGGTMIGTTDLLFGVHELNGSGLSGVASLHDNGDGTATISGTAPSRAGTFPITITARNGVSPTVRQNFLFYAGTAPSITSDASARFVIGTAGSFTVATRGYPTPSVTESGALPTVSASPTTATGRRRSPAPRRAAPAAPTR